ncbi:hypothetical protein GCM10009087_41120 [Sphingomonas oligophenolica]|uniref:Helix-turn-helix domain-containing protein n=1 Tax=Sphingomonas oligophenolica TaxID=301154 RepID=A0ABU9YCX5_9SPHN
MVYKPGFAAEARHLCRLGATDEELAEHFGVCVRTIYRWRNTHEEFAEAVVAGKEHADARVERALYSRAVGCSVERTKVFKSASDPKPVYATYTHYFPPDPNAALQWLRVRQPKKWRIAEEEKGDPGVIAMFEKAIARVNDPESPFSRPPREPPPEAAAPDTAPPPPPDPISPLAPAPGPAPPPSVLPPGPPPGPPPGNVSRVGRVYAPVYAPLP